MTHSEIYSCNYEKLLTVEIHNHILRYLAVIMRTKVTIVRYEMKSHSEIYSHNCHKRDCSHKRDCHNCEILSHFEICSQNYESHSC